MGREFMSSRKIISLLLICIFAVNSFSCCKVFATNKDITEKKFEIENNNPQPESEKLEKVKEEDLIAEIKKLKRQTCILKKECEEEKAKSASFRIKSAVLTILTLACYFISNIWIFNDFQSIENRLDRNTGNSNKAIKINRGKIHELSRQIETVNDVVSKLNDFSKNIKANRDKIYELSRQIETVKDDVANKINNISKQSNSNSNNNYNTEDSRTFQPLSDFYKNFDIADQTLKQLKNKCDSYQSNSYLVEAGANYTNEKIESLANSLSYIKKDLLSLNYGLNITSSKLNSLDKDFYSYKNNDIDPRILKIESRLNSSISELNSLKTLQDQQNQDFQEFRTGLDSLEFNIKQNNEHNTHLFWAQTLVHGIGLFLGRNLGIF